MILGTFLDAGTRHELSTRPRPTAILKSPETLRRLFLDDCHSGKTVSYFGNAAHVLPYLPHSEAVLFELSDTRPIGFNPLADTDMPNKLPDAIGKVWSSSIATTQLDRYLIPACIALIETGGTLFQLPYLYSSPQFRARVLGKLQDPVIRKELEAFGERQPREQHDQTNSLENRFVVLKTDVAIRRILSQKKRLKQPGILIVDLPDNERYDFIATLLMATLTGTAYIERPLLHIGNTVPVVACDYLGQLPTNLKDKLLGTGIIMATRLGPADARELSPHFDVDPGNTALHEVPNGKALVRMEKTHLIDLFPITYPARPSMARKVRNRTRSQYGTPAEHVDARIERFIDGL
jgi:hypothetical protein